MDDVLRKPVALIDADLDEVAGGGDRRHQMSNIVVAFGNGNAVGNGVEQENVNASGNNFGVII